MLKHFTKHLFKDKLSLKLKEDMPSLHNVRQASLILHLNVEYKCELHAIFE